MSEDASAGPVRTLTGIGERLAFFHQWHGEFGREAGMAAAMSCALREGEVCALIGAMHALRGVAANGLGESLGKVGASDPARDFRPGFSRGLSHACGCVVTGFAHKYTGMTEERPNQ